MEALPPDPEIAELTREREADANSGNRPFVRSEQL
jgi:hypothetical protein